MAGKFGNIDHLKRNRHIEGEEGIIIKIDDTTFFSVLAATDANPKWRKFAKPRVDEIRRRENAGAGEEEVRGLLSAVYADLLVTDWHGGQDEAGNFKPGGPVDVAGNPVAFNAANCAAYLTEADDAFAKVQTYCFDSQNFRRTRVAEIVEEAKN